MTRTVIIMGMHRSGSSLVAKMFYELGVNLGVDLMAGDEANPEGYYENWDFVNLNNSLLAENGGSWNNPVLIKEPDVRCRDLINKYKDELWGWKDNRTAFTFKAYEPYLENILFVITHRNKKSIVNSLFETHIGQFNMEDRTPEVMEKLYDKYYETIDEVTKGYNRIDIHYEDLINNKYFKKQLKHF